MPVHSRRIVAAGTPGAAATDAADAAPGTAEGAVLAHRQDEVLAAAGGKSADGRQQRAQQQLIRSDPGDQQGREEVGQHYQRAADHASLLGVSFRASCLTSRTSVSCNSTSVGS